MATLIPQTQTNPNLGGSSAVSSMAAQGHGSTSTNASAADSAGIGDSESLVKSARWSNFEAAPPGEVTSLRLKLSWNVSGSVSASIPDVGATAAADASFSLQYSIDGGSNWTTIASDSAEADAPGSSPDSFTSNTSADITLLTTQTISLVQVRVRYDTSASATGVDSQEASSSSGVTATVSSIRLEVETQLAGQMIITM